VSVNAYEASITTTLKVNGRVTERSRLVHQRQDVSLNPDRRRNARRRPRPVGLQDSSLSSGGTTACPCSSDMRAAIVSMPSHRFCQADVLIVGVLVVVVIGNGQHHNGRVPFTSSMASMAGAPHGSRAARVAARAFERG